MGNEQYYNLGRADSLRKLPANPMGSGAGTPDQYNHYMNGYNSVQEQRDFAVVEKFLSRPFSILDPLKKTSTALEKIVVSGLEFCLKAISNESKSGNSLSDAEMFCMTSFIALYSLNPKRAISYAGKFNSIQLNKMGSEDIAKFPGRLIIPIKTSPDGKESWGNLNSLEEVSRIFTYGLLNKIAEEEYSSAITRPDEVYLKFVQALAMENHSDSARFNVSAFNETQKALVSPKKRKVKQIVETGSKFKYGISLEQIE